MRTLTLILLLACCTACGLPAAPSVAAPTPKPVPAGTLEQLRAAVGKAACTESSQCRTLPVGARACGGPESYMAYSTAGNDGAGVLALAERYRAERKASNVATGMVSDCRMIANPGAQCVAGSCQLGSPDR